VVGARATTYRVVRTTIVAERDYVKFVLRPPERAGVRAITLFACHPLAAHHQRIVVQARAS
jgi:sortase (surface protein transpeptidase)